MVRIINKSLNKDWLAIFALTKKNLQDMAQSVNDVIKIPSFNFSFLEPFNYCTPSDVKVIILGQNPYPGKNIANGIAFDINDGVNVPPSLINIIKKIEMEYGIKQIISLKSLKFWCEQGVLLVNIFPFLVANNNMAKMEYFTKWWNFLLNNLLNLYKDLPIICWGKIAENYLNKSEISFSNLITGPHPSPLSAYRGFFQKNYFTEANRRLALIKKKEINWLRAFTWE